MSDLAAALRRSFLARLSTTQAARRAMPDVRSRNAATPTADARASFIQLPLRRLQSTNNTVAALKGISEKKRFEWNTTCTFTSSARAPQKASHRGTNRPSMK
jgi:hypothetical protein